jgi:glycerol dehydrogenase
MSRTRSRALIAPQKYIQGPGEFDNIEIYTRMFGKLVFILIGSNTYKILGGRLKDVFEHTESKYVVEVFTGECSVEEIEGIADKLKKSGANVLVAIGGGKTTDTGKAAAISTGYPCIMVPTAASNDAPTSGMSIIYDNEKHFNSGVMIHKWNPNIILVDSEICAKAPIRMFKAGMCDALSTYYESSLNLRVGHDNMVDDGYRATQGGARLALMTREVLMRDGLRAVRDLENGALTDAVENVIEANTFLSGQFENVGFAIAHCVDTALSAIPETHKCLHGERVAFGIIVQMIMDNRPTEEMDETVGWLVAIGVPVTYEQLGLELNDENVNFVAEKLAAEDSHAHIMPFKVDVPYAASVIRSADAAGRYYLEKMKEGK